VLTKREWNSLNAAGRKMLRRIAGLVKDGGHCGIRFDNDLHQLQGESELSTVIKFRVI
jgi:hypothetical protein